MELEEIFQIFKHLFGLENAMKWEGFIDMKLVTWGRSWNITEWRHVTSGKWVIFILVGSTDSMNTGEL